MVPFETARIIAQCIKMFFLECSGTTGFVFVSLVQIKPIKIIGTAKFWIHENPPENGLVEFSRVEFGSDLVGRNTGKRSNNAREEPTHAHRRSCDKVVIGSDVVLRKSLFGPFLEVEAHHVEDKGNHEFGTESGGSRGDKALAEDAFDASVPPLAATRGHGVAHSFPNLEGNRNVGTSPDAPPFLICKFRIAEHSDFEFKEPQLVLVHVADDNLGGSFNGVIENNVSRGTNPKDDVVWSDVEDFEVDGRIFPANIVNVGSVANAVDHVEGLLHDVPSNVQTENGCGGIGDL